MESKINKEKIMKYVGAGLLTAAIGLGVGLEVYDTHVDHTKEICPITQLGFIPLAIEGEYTPGFTLGVAAHQWPEMEKEYAEKGIEDVTISYGKITAQDVKTEITSPIKDSTGNFYCAPAGYVLTTDENGNPVCVRTSTYEKSLGYGLKATWGEASIDPETSDVTYENQEVLKVKQIEVEILLFFCYIVVSKVIFMNELKFETQDKNGNRVICDVIATYHDDNTNKDFIVYTDKTLDENNKLKLYYSLYKKEGNNIKLIDITDINDKKIGLELIKQLINDIRQ